MAFQLLTEQDQLLIGGFITDLILERPFSGMGLDGPFEPYTPAYAALKGKTLVDLINTGRMLDSILVEFEDEEMKFTIPGVDYAIHVNNRRRFFGLTQDEVKKELIPYIKKLIIKNIENAFPKNKKVVVQVTI